MNLYACCFMCRREYYQDVEEGDVFLYPSNSYRALLKRMKANVVVFCGVRSLLDTYLRYWAILRTSSVQYVLITERHLSVLGDLLPKEAAVTITSEARILTPDGHQFQNKYRLSCYDIQRSLV